VPRATTAFVTGSMNASVSTGAGGTGESAEMSGSILPFNSQSMPSQPFSKIEFRTTEARSTVRETATPKSRLKAMVLPSTFAAVRPR